MRATTRISLAAALYAALGLALQYALAVAMAAAQQPAVNPRQGVAKVQAAAKGESVVKKPDGGPNSSPAPTAAEEPAELPVPDNLAKDLFKAQANQAAAQRNVEHWQGAWIAARDAITAFCKANKRQPTFDSNGDPVCVKQQKEPAMSEKPKP